MCSQKNSMASIESVVFFAVLLCLAAMCTGQPLTCSSQTLTAHIRDSPSIQARGCGQLFASTVIVEIGELQVNGQAVFRPATLQVTPQSSVVLNFHGNTVSAPCVLPLDMSSSVEISFLSDLPVADCAVVSWYDQSHWLLEVICGVAPLRSAGASFLQTDVCTATYVVQPWSSTVVPPTPSTNPALVGDPCFIDNAAATPFEDVDRCLRSVPFRADWHHSTVATLRGILQLYAYRDINAHSPPPFNLRVNIDEELAQLDTQTFDSDLASHVEFSHLLASMRDGHVQYHPPACYFDVGMDLFQPLYFSSAVDDQWAQVVVVDGAVSDDLMRSWWMEHDDGFDPLAYLGYRLLFIDQIPALQALTTYANLVQDAKTVGQRFNRVIHSEDYCSWSRRRLLRCYPESSFVTYVLEHPVTGAQVELQARWLQAPGGRFTPASQRLAECSVPQPTTVPQKRVSSDVVDSTPPQVWSTSASRPAITFSSEIHARDEPTLQSLMIGAGFGLTLKRIATDWEVGVLTVDSFNGDSAYFQIATYVMTTYATYRYNLAKLIVDVSDNGGGIVQLGAYLVGLISGADDLNALYDYDMIHSELVDELFNWTWESVQNCNPSNLSVNPHIVDPRIQPFLWNWVVLPTGQLPPIMATGEQGPTCDGWYRPGVSKSYGDRTSRYSQKVELPELQVLLNKLQARPEYRPRPSQSLMVTTNGFCGSTCSLFVRGLRDLGPRVQLIAWGGLLGEPFDADQVAASVVGMDDLWPLWQAAVDDPDLGLPVASIPPPWPQRRTTNFQIVRFAAYRPTSPETPAEFTAQPVDARIEFWEVEPAGREHAVLLASQYFSCCFEWEQELAVEQGRTCERMCSDVAVTGAAAANAPSKVVEGVLVCLLAGLTLSMM
jgi:hypothetical protein